MVTYVGRKYFRVRPEGWLSDSKTRYMNDDWREDTQYTQSTKLYEREKDFENEKEAARLFNKIRGELNWYGAEKRFSLYELREIEAIIDSCRPR